MDCVEQMSLHNISDGKLSTAQSVMQHFAFGATLEIQQALWYDGMERKVIHSV